MASIQKKGGSYYVVTELPHGADGKRRQKWTAAGRTKREAVQLRTKMAYEMDQGTFIEPSKVTVGEYLLDWLENAARPTLGARTFQTYEDTVRKSIIPSIGGIKLSKLEPRDIQAHYGRELRTGGRKGTGLSARTVLNQHRVLRRALSRAVQWKLIPTNPADGVEPPRPAKTEARVLSRDQLPEVLAAVAGTHLAGPVSFALQTGARRGEILALHWQDVDLDGKLALIRYSLTQTRSGLALKPPKTKRSRRNIRIPDRLVRELLAHRAAQDAERALLGEAYSDNDLVFPDELGGFRKPDSFSSAFSQAMRQAGIDISFHGLRHTHATLLLEEGVNPKVVSDRLGHAQVALTLDVYSHVLPVMQDQAADAIDRAMPDA